MFQHHHQNKKNLILELSIVLLLIMSFLLAKTSLVRAVNLPSFSKPTLSNPVPSFDSMATLMAKVPGILQGFAGVIFVVVLVLSGYKFLMSAGNKETSDSAKKSLIWAVVGLIITILGPLLATSLYNYFSQ